MTSRWSSSSRQHEASAEAPCARRTRGPARSLDILSGQAVPTTRMRESGATRAWCSRYDLNGFDDTVVLGETCRSTCSRSASTSTSDQESLMNRRAWSLVGLGVLTLLAAEPLAQNGSTSWDATFRELPQPANIRASMERLSARPHHVGSPYDKDNAEWLLARFKEWGWDAQIETFSVLFPTPKERLLELVEPTRFTATLEEPSLRIDPTSDQKNEQLPTYNAYSIDGDVTGPLVYVNYGRPEDYE